MKYIIRYFCISHIGKVRSMNQDNFICDGKYMEDNGTPMCFPLRGTLESESPVMFGIFDGMGGEECGEIASLIAAECASQMKFGRKLTDDLIDYCSVTNDKICDYAIQNGVPGMGTTAAIIVFAKSDIAICNIGDSKIFLFADRKLEQISTDDHSVAPFGVKPPLLQNLGIPASEMIIEPHVATGRYNDGDIYLICSDGLTDMVDEKSIAGILEDTEFDNCVNVLQEKALENGGRDNITLILCRVDRKGFSLFR